MSRPLYGAQCCRAARRDDEARRCPHEPMIRIGTAGWANPRDHQAARPPGRSHLQHYATCFSCVEINSSFYRTHQRKTYERWAQTSGPGFRFSVKIPKALSHDAALRCSVEELDEFVDGVRGLGAKLGVLLLQLPRQVEWHARDARRFFGLLKDRIEVPIACEPRHPSWAAASAGRLLREFDIAWVYADPVRVSPPWDSAGRVRYHRLHGFPRVYWSSYPEGDLRELACRLSVEGGESEVWCIFDNTAGGAAWVDAQSLASYVRAGSARARAAAKRGRSGGPLALTTP